MNAFTWNGIETEGLSHLKSSFEWYISTVDSLEKPQRDVLRLRDTYKRFLGFWNDSITGKDREKLRKNIKRFFENSVAECEKFIKKYGDTEGDIYDIMEFDAEVLKLIDNA